MNQKILNILALCLSMLWVLILFRGLPEFVDDPDRVLALITLILLDFLLIVVGGASAISASRRKSSWRIVLSILAIPALHLLGSITESPINLICFFAPIAVLPVMILIKWNSSVADG